MRNYTTTGISFTGDGAKTEVCECHEAEDGTFSLIHDSMHIDSVTLEDLEQIESLLHDFIELRRTEEQ